MEKLRALLVLATIYGSVDAKISDGRTNNFKNITTDLLCRTNLGPPLKLGSWFDVITCARCYSYMPEYMFKSESDRLIYKGGPFLWKAEVVNNTLNFTDKYFVNVSNESSPIFDSFIDDRAKNKWTDCCRYAVNCCQKMLSDKPLNSAKGQLYCPRTWDGWACFPDTKSGETAYVPCPDYVYFSSSPPGCQLSAKKTCTENGTWFSKRPNNQTTYEWTDYYPCGIRKELLERIYVHCAAYAITIIAIVPAIILFSAYKQLQVPRIKLHKNLFVSLLANAICVLAFKSVMVRHVQDGGKSLISDNTAGCKILLILTRYFRSTNYMWMFCEGFYLHKLIAAAFAEQKSMLPFYLIGWGFPMIVVVAYSIIRWTMFDSLCWALPVNPYEWIINGPNMMSIIINFGFLANILRVLWSKLQAHHANEPSQFRKAVKATIVLIPLFGVHFLLIIYRPQSGGDCVLTKVHFFAHYLVDGLQGFLVALIYCYMNSEVRMLVKRTHRRLKERHEIRNNKSRTLSYTTNYTSVADSVLQNTVSRRDKYGTGGGTDYKSEMEMTTLNTPEKSPTLPT
ncbi:Uncharacterised protein g4162 [Pycnogonum litorale]